MHLQKLLTVLSSLTVVGLSTPVVSQELPNTTKPNEFPPSPTIQIQIQTHSTPTEQTTSKPTLNKNTIQTGAIDTIFESSLNRRSIVTPPEMGMGMGMGIIFPTSIVTEQKNSNSKRGDETVVWVQPPPTSKMHPPI